MKMSAASNRRWLAAPLLFGVVALGACANNVPRPTDAVSQAELTLQEASDSDAAQYAPLPLRKAREKLEQSRQAMEAGEHTRARRLAEEAMVDAQLAQAVASAETAENAIEELRASLQTLREEGAQKQGEPVKTGTEEAQQ